MSQDDPFLTPHNSGRIRTTVEGQLCPAKQNVVSTSGLCCFRNRFYAAENPGAKDRAGVVMRGPVSGTARAANPVI